MAVGTLTTLASAYKLVYKEKVRAALSNKFVAEIIKEKKPLQGKAIVQPFETSFAGSGQNIAEGGSLPTAVTMVVTEATFYWATYGDQTQLSGLAMAAGRNNEGYTVDAGVVADNSESLALRYANTIDKMSIFGGAAKLYFCQRKAEVGSADWACDGDLAGAQSVLTNKGSAIGVDLKRMDTYASISSETVSAIDQVTGTVTMSAADTSAVAAGWGIVGVLTDTTTASTLGSTLAAEQPGLLSIAGLQTYAGVDRSSIANSVLRSTVFTVSTSASGGRSALTLARINDLKATLSQRVDQGMFPIDTLVIRTGDRAKFNALVQGNIYNDGSSTGLAPSTFAATYDGMKLVYDINVPQGMIIMLSSKAVGLSRAMGNDPFRKASFERLQQTDAYYIPLTDYYTITSRAPQAVGVLCGITL